MTNNVNTESPARSQSRGREAFVSSGRGGAGNMYRPSKSREPMGGNEFSPTRGRELAVDPSKIMSTGRGGAGNIRSRSRDLLSKGVPLAGGGEGVAEERYEQDVIQRHVEAEKTSTALHSSGRGGAGNIARSRSIGPNAGARSTSRAPPPTHSTGRGGAGNIVPGDGKNTDALDDEERKQHTHAPAVHSTGRGGAGNITDEAAPLIEHHAATDTTVHSSGRGGAGNIHQHHHHKDHPHHDPVHSTGRGGAGNIVPGDAAAADSLDYAERKEHHAQPDGMHSTGRGGAGNITETPGPPVEHHQHHPHGAESTGRGGAGNIHTLPSLLAKAHIRHD